MATSKTLAPTNVTISIPAMTDAPDQAVNSNCIDKLGDAVNALNSQITNVETTNVLSLDSNVVNTSDANSSTVKVNKIVQVRCQFKFKTTPTVGTEYTIGTLPVGYRPAVDTWYATSGTGGAWANTDLGVVNFKTNGNVTVTPRGVATSNWYMFNATFITA